MGAISKSWWFIGLYKSTDDALAVSNSFERILWRFRFCKANCGLFHWCSLLGINELRIAPQWNWKEKNLKSFITSSGIKNDIYQERGGERGRVRTIFNSCTKPVPSRKYTYLDWQSTVWKFKNFLLQRVYMKFGLNRAIRNLFMLRNSINGTIHSGLFKIWNVIE